MVTYDTYQQYLYFINDSYKRLIQPTSGETVGDYNLRLSVTYYGLDGSVIALIQQPLTTISPTPDSGSTTGNTGDGVYYVNVSPSNLGISASDGTISGETVAYYNCRVQALFTLGGSTLTDNQYFRIREDALQNFRSGYEVMWLNEYGGYDSFNFLGQNTDTISRGASDLRKTVDYNFPDGYEINSVYDTNVTLQWKMESGAIDEDHFNFLQSLLNSNKVYLVNKRGNNFDGITFCTVSEFTYEKINTTNQYNVSLTLNKTIKQNNISV